MEFVTATAKVILDERRIKENGSYPLKLRITSKGKRVYYSVDEELSKDDFFKLNSLKLRDSKLKAVKLTIEEHEAKANRIIKAMGNFKFDEFETQFFPKLEEKKSKDLAENFDKYIQNLRNEDRVSTASSYLNAKSSLLKFQKKIDLDEINAEFLKNYEKYMLNIGNSSTSVGIYLRSLRAVYNRAIELNIIEKTEYPFVKRKFQIPAGRNIKKALTIEEVKMIFDYKTKPYSPIDKAKDFWIFSYLCNGLNIKDICKIQWKDINKDKLTVYRSKTINTSKGDQTPIIILLNEYTKEIIRKWQSDTYINSDSYVFTILKSGLTAQRERELINGFTKTTNKYTKIIGKDLKFEMPLTTYVARHSFSTVLKRSGVSESYISESLGHSSLATTKKYLGSFEDRVKKENTDLLVKFD